MPDAAASGAGRVAANTLEDTLLDVNERILKEISETYSDKVAADAATKRAVFTSEEPKLRPAELKPGEDGLMAICHKLGLSCIAPRRKINVMIVGNHSAGKSSYINWYIGEHVQSTAVAIETQGFTFCTSGKKRETLTGRATMKFHPHLQPDLEQYAPQIYNGLQTEISTSKERSFPLITFIDTPGLVDGSFHYPFQVEDAILSVAKHTDLIYIFFDPIGQALCDRTMNVIERLNHEHAEKLRYFLSKADTVPNERDRQKVVVQITQNLSSRVRNAHAFELPSLYIPGFSEKRCSIDNILDATCQEMHQTINQSVQNNLNKLEADCKMVSRKIDELLSDDVKARQRNRSAFCQGILAFLGSLLAPLLLVAFLLHRTGLTKHELLTTTIPPHLLAHFGDTCDAIVAPEPAALPAVDAQEGAAALAAPPGGGGASGSGLLTLPQLMFGLLGCFLALQLLSRVLWRLEPQLSKKEEKNLKATQQLVMTEVLETKARLYKQYLDEVMSEVQ